MKENVLNGIGKIIWNDTLYYQCEFLNHMKHGIGTDQMVLFINVNFIFIKWIMVMVLFIIITIIFLKVKSMIMK